MNASRRRQRKPFVAAVALLAAAFVLWTADVSPASDEGAGEIFRRMLEGTKLKSYQKPELIANRVHLIGEGACNGVLITSQGGVGSSAFIAELLRVEMRGASFYTNDDQDADGLKHLPASKWRRHSATEMRHAANVAREGEDCYNKALVIIGDPVHTIESTYRRFRTAHIDKLKRYSGQGMFKAKNTRNVGVIYNDIADHGSDTTGITHYVSSWYEASRDREHWPDIRIVTAKTLFNDAADHARWIGVDEGSLSPFEQLYFDEEKQHASEPSVNDEEVKEKVMSVFGTVNEIVYNPGIGLSKLFGSVQIL